MKKALLVVLLTAGFAFAQTPQAAALNDGGGKNVAKWDTLSLYQVNYIPPDSLKIADSLGVSGRASLTDSPYLKDTITVTGVVIADPALIGISAGNTNFYIQSADSAEWGGMNIFGNSTTASSIGISSADTGYVIKLTGTLTKYSASSILGNFEMVPIANQTLEIVNIGPRPAPREVKLSDLVKGDLSSNGTMKFNPGMKYRNSYVIIRNLTVKSISTFTSSVGKAWDVVVQDSYGNLLDVYDGSKYFTSRSYGADTTYTPPAVGSKLDYIRGILTAYATTGYRITPLYPGDMKIKAYTPSITATGFISRRSTAFPLPSQSVIVRITAVSINPDTSVKVDSAAVYYSVNNGAYVRLKMTPDTSNTFVGTIPAQSDGAFVKYFFSAWQDTSRSQSISPDTSTSDYFYYVRGSGYTIKDIQYTPFTDGASGVIDLKIAVNGIVQGDTSDYPREIDHRNQSTKTSVTYIQDAAKAYSGIMLYGSRAYKVHRGDSVTVYGSVTEYSGMTELNVDSVNVIQSGKQPYAPVAVKTGDVGGKPSGDLVAEQWESVLVRFDSVEVTDVDPDPSYSITSANGSFREYIVDDGSGGCRVDDDGSNMYSPDPHDTAYGFQIIPKGATFQSLTGILKYANGAYKLEPRTNADFGTMTGIKREPTGIPAKFALEQNFPNPFNPSTTLRYSVPKAGVVTLKVYNVLGQEVETLVNQQQVAGTYSVTFNASRLASGVYFYRLSTGSYNAVKKMLLLK